ncbi:MAG: gamma-glutamylcyclotransferase family protein [Planctomycetota bacterium]
MTDETVRIFAYGTLMPGCPNHWQIERYVRAARLGRIQGVLVDLGAFPALVAGDGIVKGIALDVDEAALAITDRIEGYGPGRRPCLYLRKEVTVELDDGEEVRAWTYEFADPERIADRPRLIVGSAGGIPVHAWRAEGDDPGPA